MSSIVGILKDRMQTLYLNHSVGGVGFIAVPQYHFWSKNDHSDPACFDQPVSLLLLLFCCLFAIAMRN